MNKMRVVLLCLVSLMFIFIGSLSAETVAIAKGVIENLDAYAVEPNRAPEPPLWGTISPIVKQVQAFSCNPLFSTTEFTWVNQGGAQRYCTAGLCAFECNVDVPTGGQIIGLELDGCDSSNTGYIGAFLLRDSWGSGGYHVVDSLSSGTAATPGCGVFYKALATPLTVYNYTNSYFIEAFLSTNSTATTFSSIRVFYTLQISPAPATASFPDVPTTHWAFQFIEALKDSGITTGYGDGTFRPNNNVTRAEMAAFLARALGLHWPY